MLKIISILLIALLIISCSKKERAVNSIEQPRVYENDNKPADPNFKYTFKEIKRIPFRNKQWDYFKFSSNFGVTDRFGNYYCMNEKGDQMMKLDSNFNFVQYIGRPGKGPGEFEYSGSPVVQNDTLYIYTFATSQVSMFDLEGKFIRYINQGVSKNAFVEFKAYSKDRFLCNSTDWETDKEKNKTKVNSKHYISDTRFAALVPILNMTVQPEPDPKYGFVMQYDILPLSYVYHDTILVIDKSIDRFLITAYDQKGKKLFDIKRRWAKIRHSDAEIKFKEKELIGIEFEKNQYSINSLKIDRYNRLWIESGILRNEKNENSFLIDIYDQYKFINRLEIPFINGKSEGHCGKYMTFLNNKLIVTDIWNDETIVYDYK